MTSDSTKPAIGYVYLTSGTKAQFLRDKQKLPGFAKQAAMITLHARSKGLKVSRWHVDHNTSRTARVFDQAEFVAALFEAEHRGMAIVVADFFRLAARYATEDSLSQIVRLKGSPVEIIDATSSQSIQNIPRELTKFLLSNAIKASNAHSVVVKMGLKDGGSIAASRAKGANRPVVRRAQAKRSYSVADHHALSVLKLVTQISSELPEAHRENYAAIARELNRREIRTRSGNAWTRQQVRRTLSRAVQFRRRKEAKKK